MRITNNMISRQVLSNLQRNFQSVASLQNVLSTGRQFQFPEQNPIAFTESLNLRQEIAENRRYQRNISLGTTNLELTESTLANVNDRLQRARQLAIQGANETLSGEARNAIANEIEQILSNVIEQANSNFEGRFLFAGDETLRKPFEAISSGGSSLGVVYRGDFGDRLVEINQGEFLPINLTGPGAFFTSLNEIRSRVAVTASTPLAPQLAAVDPPLAAGAGTFTVNGVAISFDPATDTLENLRDSINREVDTAEASIDSSGRLVIRSLTSNDVELANGTSNVLEVLGLYHRVEGGAIGAGITPATTLASLGIAGDALRIAVGDEEFEVDLAGATTVGDVLTAINSSGAPVEAFINGAGTGLTFSATRTVDSLEITSLRKVFGSTALAPGAVTADTTLASLGILNPGILQITNDGALTEVDLSGAATVGQVLSAINSQVNGVTASINADGTGLDLESAFLSGSLSAADVGPSNIAAVLGFAQTRSEDNASDFAVTNSGTVDETQGRNIFRSLSDLVQVLRSDNPASSDFDSVLEAFDTDLTTIQTNRSIVGARMNRTESALDRFQAFEVFLTQLLSENEDADLAETVTQLSTQTNVLNAALASGSRVLLPSLIDFLQ